jgi:hypothetical protein
MEYEGPEPADLANVEALNRAFLRWLRTRAKRRAADDRVAALARRISALKECEIERLSRAPFLLMTVGERDERRWQEVFGNRANVDLLDTDYSPDRVEGRIVMATVGFLWHLARRNPYAARLVSGTSLEWCDQLARQPIAALFDQIEALAPPMPRLADDGDFWRKLLNAGTSVRKDIRLAARLSALQTVITRSAARTTRGPLAVAACEMPPVSMRLSDRRRS